jgi:flagellar hook-length control protein FliK
MSGPISTAPAAPLHTAGPGAAPAARLRGAGAGPAPAAAHAVTGATSGAVDAFAALLELAGADDSTGVGVPTGARSGAATAAASAGSDQDAREIDPAARPAAGDALLLLAPPAGVPTFLAEAKPTAPAGGDTPAPVPLREASPAAAQAGLEASPALAGGDSLLRLAATAQPLATVAGGDPTSLAETKPTTPAGKDTRARAPADSAPAAIADAASPRSPNGFAALLAQASPDPAAPLREASLTAERRGLEAPPGLLLQLPISAPAATPTPAAPAAVHQAALPSQPLDAAFAGDLAAEVRVMVDAGIQRAELRLNPADLGPIHIELSLSAQTADISFAAAHSATRDGLAQALPALREMLAGQGLSLGHAGVSSGQQGQTFADAQHQARAVPQGTARTGGGAEPAGSGWASGAIVLRTGRGMLDLYA